MVRTRTNKTSRSTEVRTHGTTIHMDLFGPVDVEGRGGVRYGFVAAVETHYVNNGTLTRGPDYPWVRALRSKDEAIIAITELHNELMAQGITLRIAFSDSGGKFSDSLRGKHTVRAGVHCYLPGPSEPDGHQSLE